MAEKKANAKEKILKTALKIFSEKGYHATNIEEIVEKSDASKGGFYFHFPSKKELFLTLVDEMTNILFSKVEKEVAKSSDVLEQIEKALEKGVRVFTKYRSLAKFLLVEAVGSGSAFEEKRFAIYTRFARLIKKLLDKAMAEQRINPVDTEVISWIWVGAVSQLIVRWLYLEGAEPLEEDLPVLKETLLKSIGLERVVSKNVNKNSA